MKYNGILFCDSLPHRSELGKMPKRLQGVWTFSQFSSVHLHVILPMRKVMLEFLPLAATQSHRRKNKTLDHVHFI